MATRKTNTAVKKAAAAPVVSTISVTFEGMMILFAHIGSPYCDVGILKYAPDHVANILITRMSNVGAPETLLHLHDAELESRMWLDVENSEASITLFEDRRVRFDRAADHGNEADFRWALDFEGDEMYKVKISVDPAGFKSILRINDGTFYTQEKSLNKLVKKWKAEEVILGRVAVKLRADIILTENSPAYFSNGVNGKPLALRAVENVNYGIYVSHVRHDHAGGNAHASSDEVDAENYNSAVAVDQPSNRKIHFDREGTMRLSPDAVCLTATMSRTKLPST